MANTKKTKTQVTLNLNPEEIKKLATRFMTLNSRKKAIEAEMDAIRKALTFAVDQNGTDNKLTVARSKDTIKITAIPYRKEYVTFEDLKKRYPSVAKELRKISEYVSIRVTKGKKGEG